MQKTVYLESIDSEIIVARRKGARSMRLSLRSDGKIRLTIPYGIPEIIALKFLNSKKQWIKEHAKPKVLISDGAHIGKSHRLVIERRGVDKPRTRILCNEIIITIANNNSADSDEVQQIIRKACEKALKIEANTLLAQRLEFLSVKYKINYKSVSMKKLKSRWGSCDSNKNIVLNIYLIQLDWKIIDYVLAHELTHTLHQHHQSDFWQALKNIMPDYKERRTKLKEFPTNVISTNF
jgi:hypothetical protein